MSADIVNLNQFRKRKARSEKERVAAENRVRFGRDRDIRALESHERERERRTWENNRIEPSGSNKEDS